MSTLENTIVNLIKEFFRSITDGIDALRAQGVQLMETVQSVQDKLDQINVAIAEERTEVQNLLNALRQQIQDLQNQLGQGQLVTQEQLDSLGAAADAIVARVRDISEPVA